MIFSGLYLYFPRTLPGLSKDILRSFSELSQDILRTFSGLYQDCPRTFSEFGTDCLGLVSSAYSYFIANNNLFLAATRRLVAGCSWMSVGVS